MNSRKIYELYLDRPEHLIIRQAAPTRPLADNEARVRLIYGGICGSDLKVLHGTIPYAEYPCRPGHEILGTVIEAGKNAAVTTGSRVLSFPNTYCSRCQFCVEHRTNICPEKQSFGVTINGLFATEIPIDSQFLIPVPRELPDERAILAEPLAVGIHALKKANISTATSVAVIGCGTEGLLLVALLNYMGARITVLDINPAKMEKARLFNDSVKILNPAKIQAETFDVVIEAAGAKTAIEQAFVLVKPGGTLVTLGITGEDVLFPSLHVTRSEISVHGSIIYTKNDFEEALDILSDKEFFVSPVLSKIMPFEDSVKAFEDADSGNFTKIVIDFQGCR